MNFTDDLNAPQRSAVTHTDGPLVIFAGAGSGKTRTLTRRIAYLMTEQGIPAWRILAVTFTNKAAREMRERIETLVGPAAQRLWMGTFHSMCARMLRMHGERIGIDPHFVIFDSDDSTRLIKEIVGAAGLDSQRFKPASFLHQISDAKNKLQSPAAMIDPPNHRSKNTPRNFTSNIRNACAPRTRWILMIFWANLSGFWKPARKRVNTGATVFNMY